MTTALGKTAKAVTGIFLGSFWWVGLTAAPVPVGQEQFSIGIGGVFAHFDTEIRVDDRTINLGTVIDLEDDLNLDDSEEYLSLAASWRLAPRHRLGLITNTSSRSTSAVLSEDIEFEDITIPAGSMVSFRHDIDIYEIVYLYSFVQNDRLEFSGGIGIHWIDTEALLDTNVIDASRDADTRGPLPNLGVDLEYAITPKWRARGRAQVLALEYGKYDGRMFDFKLGLEYHFENRVAVGVNYSRFSVAVNVDDGGDWFGRFDYDIDGPSLYLKYNW